MDELMQAYYKLTQQTEIPDVKVYAEQFEQLADLFSQKLRPAMAETCYSKAGQYKQLAGMITAVRRVPINKNLVMLESLTKM
jgi:hypothetical protein